MAETGGIRAGRAFVEAYLDKTKLTRGLKSVSADLKAFGAGVSSLGTKFMALGAGIAAPMLGAAKVFADFGSQLNDMSARTGMGTNVLSELGFAADMTGASIEVVEKSIRKMQKTISDASTGEKTYVDALKAVGLSYQELQGMSPEKQFEMIAEGINNISDPTQRAAAAMEIFGKSGTALLPMIGDMKALRAEAVRLGLSIGPEQAADADALGDAWDKVKGSFKAVALSVGASLAPMLTGLSDKITNGIVAVREFVSTHKPLIVSLFAAGASAIAAGVGLFTLGKAITLTGAAIGMTMTIAKSAAATFGFLQSAAFLLANPFVLVGAAAVALGGYLLYVSGVAGKVGTWISQTFATLLSEVTNTFSVIADSMAAGDLVSAAKVGWALIALEWQKGVSVITGIWEGFKGLYDEACMGLAISMINASASIQTIWADLLNWMAKKWEEFGTSAFTETLASWIAPIVATLNGLKTEDVQKALKEDFARARAGQGKKIEGMDASTAARKKAIEDERAAKVGVIGSDLLMRGDGRNAKVQAAQDAVDAAKREWQDAQAKAKIAASAKGSLFGFGGKVKGMEDIDLNAAKGPSASTRGTFSASAASGLGVGNIQERIAKASENTFKFVGQQTTILREISGKLEASA